MKVISWNVNGIRSLVKTGHFLKVIKEMPDVLCMQEMKLSTSEFPSETQGYEAYLNPAERKGYSGTAILSREKAISVFSDSSIKGFPLASEGRVICAQYREFYVVNVYAPVATTIEKLFEKIEWFIWLKDLVDGLTRSKPVMLMGDFNVAYAEIDTCLGSYANGTPGCTQSERNSLKSLIGTEFVDAFRLFHFNGGEYTWWNYKGDSRRMNKGWRTDYIFLPKQMVESIRSCSILSNMTGSDHAPVEVVLNK